MSGRGSDTFIDEGYITEEEYNPDLISRRNLQKFDRKLSREEEDRAIIWDDLTADIVPARWIFTEKNVEAIEHLEVLKQIEEARTSTKATRKANKRERLNKAKGRCK